MFFFNPSLLLSWHGPSYSMPRWPSRLCSSLWMAPPMWLIPQARRRLRGFGARAILPLLLIRDHRASAQPAALPGIGQRVWSVQLWHAAPCNVMYSVRLARGATSIAIIPETGSPVQCVRRHPHLVRVRHAPAWVGSHACPLQRLDATGAIPLAETCWWSCAASSTTAVLARGAPAEPRCDAESPFCLRRWP